MEKNYQRNSTSLVSGERVVARGIDGGSGGGDGGTERMRPNHYHSDRLSNYR